MFSKPKLFQWLLGRRQRKLSKVWDNFLKIPRAQLQVCMTVLRNKNRMQKRDLIRELIRIGEADTKQSCYMTIKRGCDNNILVEDSEGYISVKEPTYVLFKIVRGNVLDNWQVIILPSLLLTVLFAGINSDVCGVFGFLSLLGVVAWFVENWYYTVKS